MDNIQPKPLFEQRMKQLIPDYEKFFEYSKKPPLNSIRCNTLKTKPEELKKRLEAKGWQIFQPYDNFPEIMIVENQLQPGELGKSIEHLLGYYYVQEISSMMPIIALQPKSNEIVLDLCASPGSKTTQAAVFMENKGTIIANDVSLDRISILSANLQKVGASNCIVTRHDGVILCEKLGKLNLQFDKILLDVPCTGEGNIRSNPKTLLMWNIKAIDKLSRLQKKLASSALELLKPDGELLYSTCTHSPEENEEIVQYLLDNEKFNLKIEEIKLPLKTRPGITEWNGNKFNKELKKAHRIYPQDNDTEGFFLAKLRKIK